MGTLANFIDGVSGLAEVIVHGEKGEPMAGIDLKLPIQVNLPDDWIEQIVNRLRNDPDAEWVEIVRCKDCIKREICRTSTTWAVAPKDDWYCADAERRTDETD